MAGRRTAGAGGEDAQREWRRGRQSLHHPVDLQRRSIPHATEATVQVPVLIKSMCSQSSVLCNLTDYVCSQIMCVICIPLALFHTQFFACYLLD